MNRIQILILILVTWIAKNGHAQSFFELPQISPDSFKQLPSGLKYHIYKHGKGQKITEGDRIYIDFVGRYINDSVFYTTAYRGPQPFYMNSGQLIRGFEEGLMQLCQGDRARFIIPWKLAYGEKQYRQFPPKSDLIFDVEVIVVWPDNPVEPFITGKIQYQKTPSGLEYCIISSGNSQKPGNNQRVMIHYTGFFKDGRIFDTSVKRDAPYEFITGEGIAIQAFDEAIRLIGKGGKIRIKAPWKLAYGINGLNPVVPPKTDVIFDIELVDVFQEVCITPFDTSGITALKTPEGVSIWIIRKGSDEKIDTSQIASVHFSGYLPNGKLFDSSVKRNKPVLVPVGAGMVIKGWDIALPYLHKGDLARIFIPYHLAYGEEGNQGNIPPKTDLYFDIEIVDIF